MSLHDRFHKSLHVSFIFSDHRISSSVQRRILNDGSLSDTIDFAKGRDARASRKNRHFDNKRCQATLTSKRNPTLHVLLKSKVEKNDLTRNCVQTSREYRTCVENVVESTAVFRLRQRRRAYPRPMRLKFSRRLKVQEKH